MKTYFLLVFLFVTVTANAQFIADFETGNLAAWQQTPTGMWSAASSTGKISGNFSLRHIGASSAGTDCISAPIEQFSLTDGDVSWRFRMRYNYNPTGTNKWAILLMSDTSATAWNGGAFNGYAIGVNQAASVVDKRLCLYAVTNRTYTELLKTTINWNDSIGTSSTTTVSMEILRSKAGEWTIRLAKTNHFDSLKSYGTVTDNRYLDANYFGAINTYSSASAGAQKLWIDDVSISSTSFPAKISAVVQKSPKTLLLDFTKAMSTNGLQDPNHYSLVGGGAVVHPQTIELKSATQLQLNFAAPLPRGSVQLMVDNLIDENNNPITDFKNIVITYNLYGDVVINEIMAVPAPAVGLPEVSYIELYNRCTTDVRMDGWKMEYNNTSGNIGAATIPANGYMILCTSSALDVMREYGNATSVSYISSLTKSGKTLSLKDNTGQLLSRVSYSDKWITDDTKHSGGWSLEKKDADNLSESAANWVVSIDEKGGTPGRKNSVQTNNPDREAPFITNLNPIDQQTVVVTFNEFFDTEKAQNPLCYSLNNGVGQPQQVILDISNPEQVMLKFSRPMNDGVLYTLSVSAPFCDLAGNIPSGLDYVFGNLFSPQTGEIVINEVLFNPYPNGVDFVELYNRSDKIFDLQQVKIANRDKNAAIASIHSITQKYFLAPNNYAVLTTNVEAVKQFYALPFPEKVINLTSLPSYPDDAGCVVLLSDNNMVVDEFSYSAKMHSGFIANPEGISLERVNPNRPSNEQANWQSASQGSGFATPTYRNSQYNATDEYSSQEISLPYDSFSPDGDGYNDVLYIDYNVGTAGYVATITVYDTQGRLVAEIAKKALLGVSGRFAWDGTRHDQHKASVGLYVIYIELYDLAGNVKRIKKTCALAMR